MSIKGKKAFFWRSAFWGRSWRPGQCWPSMRRRRPWGRRGRPRWMGGGGHLAEAVMLRRVHISAAALTFPAPCTVTARWVMAYRRRAVQAIPRPIAAASRALGYPGYPGHGGLPGTAITAAMDIPALLRLTATPPAPTGTADTGTAATGRALTTAWALPGTCRCCRWPMRPTGTAAFLTTTPMTCTTPTTRPTTAT